MRIAPLAVLLALVGLAPRAQAQGACGTAQDVTVRQINQITPANIDFLNANEAALTPAEIQARLTNPLENQLVRFTAVVLSDPRKSGLRSAVNGIPGGIHFFVRDVTAATAGVAGMGIQVVDGSGTGLAQQFFVGDQVSFCGTVSPFLQNNGGKSMQIALVEASFTGTSTPAGDPLLAPVVVTTDDVHDVVSGQTQIDWSNYSSFNGQYVRFEGIEAVQGVAGNRPDVLLSSVGQDTQINIYDTSVCFRNDRGPSYFPAGTAPPPCIDTPFVPPSTGIVNVQGFLTYQGDTGGFNYSIPNPANFVINPFEEEDFVVASAPPIVSVADLGRIPAPDQPVTVSATIVPGNASNTITSAVLNYTIVATGVTGQVTLTRGTGDTYTGQIPGAPNRSFVTFTITAADNVGGTFTTPVRSYRAFAGPVTEIALVQQTATGGVGPSPLLTGMAAAFNLNAVVQTKYQSGTNWFATVQDDPNAAAFTGVLMFFGGTEPAFSVGDRINVTEATIAEFNGLTQLTNVTFTVTGGGSPYAPKVLSTTLFNGTGGATAGEQHEGILLRFETVRITDVNADGDDGVPGFGEWRFSSTESDADGLRADDASNAIPDGFNVDNFTLGQGRAFMQGYLTFSFGNYKIIPTRLEDIGEVIMVSNEGAPESQSVRFAGTFPNPASGSASVRFSLAEAGDVTLALYDVTGRRVGVVASGARAAGDHEATVDVRGLAAGVYVLRLDAPAGTATTRVSVVR